MSVQEPRRAARAVAIAAVGVPCALLAHLLATGRTASAPAAVLAAVAVLAIAAAVPARSTSGLALLTALTQLGAHSVLALFATGGPGGAPACLPAVGRAASLGLHLAVLRADGGCPAGTFVVAPTVVATLTALVTALVILAGHGVVALLAGLLLGRALVTAEVLAGLAVLVERVLDRTATLLARLGVRLGVPLAPSPVLPGRRGARHLTPPAATTRWAPGALTRRGPPSGELIAA